MSHTDHDLFHAALLSECDRVDRALLRLYSGEDFQFLKKDGTPDEHAAPVPIAEMIAPTMSERCTEDWVRASHAHYLAGTPTGSSARCFDSPERAAAFMEAIA